jgi:hypothetical protein
MKNQFYKKRMPVIHMIIYSMAIFCLFLLSCQKNGSGPSPIPVWEDNSADSARLNILVQTSQGMVLTGQYANLALSRDSLTNNLFVRKTGTGGTGVAVFRKLYPRILYYNCVAVTSGQTFFGSGSARLSAGLTKDTTLIVH